VSDSRNFLDYGKAERRPKDNFLLRQLVLCALMVLIVVAVVLFAMLFGVM
jgi:hypothetical protein